MQRCEPLPTVVKNALAKRSNGNASKPGVADLRVGMTTAETEATNACSGYGSGANKCYGNDAWTFSFAFDGDSLSKIYINVGSAGDDGTRYEKVKSAVKARYAKVNHELSADDVKSFLDSKGKEKFSVFNDGAVAVGLIQSESKAASDIVVQYLSGGLAASFLRQHAPRQLKISDLGAPGSAVAAAQPSSAPSSATAPMTPFMGAARVDEKECGMFWSPKSNLSASECGY